MFQFSAGTLCLFGSVVIKKNKQKARRSEKEEFREIEGEKGWCHHLEINQKHMAISNGRSEFTLRLFPGNFSLIFDTGLCSSILL